MTVVSLTAHYLALAFLVCAPLAGFNWVAGLVALFCVGVWYGHKLADHLFRRGS